MGNTTSTTDHLGTHVEREVAREYEDVRTGEVFDAPLTGPAPASSPKGNDVRYRGTRKELVEFTPKQSADAQARLAELPDDHPINKVMGR